MSGRPRDLRATHDARPALHRRVLIVFAGTVLVWLFVYHGAPLGRDDGRPTHVARAILTTLLVVPLVVAARRLLDRRPWTGLGLPSPRTGGRRRHLPRPTAPLPSRWPTPPSLAAIQGSSIEAGTPTRRG
ncbi:hypothetical protein [Micromonospora coriariae]|uniref:hypothetical protein n=1 Tax=Micromonospora coriariae TaxID=285665 RepID=UPI0012FD392D|nr:hypothetical protein [Micromonospora coriariae]